ncbi:MAG: SDR family oxidoreductase [Rhodomicrobium sp.]
MTILVTGSTGVIGSQVVARLAEKGAKVHALARSPEKAKFPQGVTPVKGDLMDIGAVRSAISQASTLFLLNAVTPDELTQALLTLSLAREAGIERIVYFSVFNSGLFTDVPHFTGKYAVERMIEDCNLPADILRPNYFMQNDLALKDALIGNGVYPQPIGSKGTSMIDTRDIAEAAALCLLKRENSTEPLPRETIELAGPDALTGAAIAGIWAQVLGREIRYGGDDLAEFEKRIAAFVPGWMARDILLMYRRFHKNGMAAQPADVEQLTGLLGHAPRSYRDFAAETAKGWQS